MKYTIFTPTYNREKDLGVLYNSLKAQTLQNFEWLIIDDGSTDQTMQIVNNFKEENIFPIRYIRQNNGGKHRAFNRAIEESRGEFIVCVDSDDYLKEYALEKIDKLSPINDKVMALCFLCVDENEKIIGTSFPENNSVFNLIDLTYRYKVRGDKLWIFRSSILKKYRFPEYEGEKFVTEGVLLFEMSLNYDILVSNEPLQIHEYKNGGLTSIGNNKLFKESPKGAKAYYRMLLQIAPNYKYKLFYLYNYIFYSVYRRKK
ncbi:glycosyltransferase family 2 protein [Bacillus paranthracis]|uniref:glycosyltransferase family 2 protein n=1 Tax=Bacillus paranthracis TaxID=2026186 RepID=UPI00254CB754|nr:glycosyltransferase family 2 protein [Bacillus paranthracis]MDK7539260.1 glycosyltransferase family 2 protein [Bacillus paranthracis]MDK7561792.1 glycosyltransferase family 2 protein [Bacillus paranthracis]